MGKGSQGHALGGLTTYLKCTAIMFLFDWTGAKGRLAQESF